MGGEIKILELEKNHYREIIEMMDFRNDGNKPLIIVRSRKG